MPAVPKSDGDKSAFVNKFGDSELGTHAKDPQFVAFFFFVLRKQRFDNISAAEIALIEKMWMEGSEMDPGKNAVMKLKEKGKDVQEQQRIHLWKPGRQVRWWSQLRGVRIERRRRQRG
jgi:hypothetical protein